MKLQERALLTSLHLGSWGGQAVDRQVTEEVGESHGADPKDSGKYNKQLISRKALREVLGKVNVCRQTHKILSLPWDDSARILSAQGYNHYTQQMRLHRLAVEAAAKKLSETFPEHVKEAKVRLGTMFNSGDYPDAAEMIKRYYVDVEIKPIPEAADFRTKLADGTIKALAKDIERRTNDRIKAAVEDVFKRVADVTGKMAERLSNYEPKGEEGASNTFRDSLVYNCVELADLLPSLNITDDPRLADLAKRLKTDLGAHSPEVLRTDAKLRKTTALAAEKLAKRVGQYLA
jgi:hypothetical protein